MIRVFSLKKVCWTLSMLLLIFSVFGISPVDVYSAETIVTQDTATQSVEADKKKEFSYNPVGKRDPFEPLINKFRQAGGKPEKEKGPLEKFDLGQFRLLAMLLGKGTPHAMVKAPDGKSYIVKPGDKIGKLDGKIVRIETKVVDPVSRSVVSPDRIVIKEIGFDPYTNKQVVEYRYITM